MNGTNSQRKESLILIVDDQVENLQILGNILNLYEYKKALATNGREAIEIATKIKPDLILLDIMMPEMDGYEVCRIIKENENTSDIPIIFLTAKSQTEDIIKGFELGGVDYITKPFKHNELIMRIKTHVDLKKSRDIIQEQNEVLRKLNEEKSELMAIAAHDLKNPLQVMVGFSKLLEESGSSLSMDEIIEIASDIRSSGESMFRIITDLLDLNAAEEGSLIFSFDRFDLTEMIRSIINQYRLKSEEKGIKIIYEPRESELYIETNPGKLAQILDNLISNAIKFSPFDKKIFIQTAIIAISDSNYVSIRVIDEGPGIAPEDFNKLFVKFARLRAKPTNKENSTRLGLSIVKKYAELLGGTARCESEYGNGATFILELPIDVGY